MRIEQLENIKLFRIFNDNNIVDLLVNEDNNDVIFIWKNGEPLDVNLWDRYIDIFNDNKNSL
mgnify:CR=1 FL=1